MINFHSVEPCPCLGPQQNNSIKFPTADRIFKTAFTDPTQATPAAAVMFQLKFAAKNRNSLSVHNQHTINFQWKKWKSFSRIFPVCGLDTTVECPCGYKLHYIFLQQSEASIMRGSVPGVDSHHPNITTRQKKSCQLLNGAEFCKYYYLSGPGASSTTTSFSLVQKAIKVTIFSFILFNGRSVQ